LAAIASVPVTQERWSWRPLEQVALLQFERDRVHRTVKA